MDKLLDVSKKIVLTGVGKDEIEDTIYDIPTAKVDEFIAIGTGGLYLSNKKSGLVVSIGTGTAFVEAKRRLEEGAIGELFLIESEYAHDYSHIGGTGGWALRCATK